MTTIRMMSNVSLRVALIFLYCFLPLSVWGHDAPHVIDIDTILTEDHVGSMLIEANNITLDCDGHRVIGAGNAVGIQLTGRTGATVKDCHVTNFSRGFRLSSSSQNNTLEGNTSNNNGFSGFLLGSSSQNTLEGNTANNNGYSGFLLGSSSQNTLEGNTANNNGFSGFHLSSSSSENTLSGNTSNDNSWGFRLSYSSQKNTLVGNTACGNGNEEKGFDISQVETDNNAFEDNGCNTSSPHGLCDRSCGDGG